MTHILQEYHYEEPKKIRNSVKNDFTQEYGTLYANMISAKRVAKCEKVAHRLKIAIKSQIDILSPPIGVGF